MADCALEHAELLAAVTRTADDDRRFHAEQDGAPATPSDVARHAVIAAACEAALAAVREHLAVCQPPTAPMPNWRSPADDPRAVR